MTSSARIVWAALVVFYAVLGFAVLKPEAIYSGDIGVKFVEARALVRSHFRSLAIPYPGEFLDPDRAFAPMRPPFVLVTKGQTQSIFSPAAAVLQAAAVSFAGISGFVLLSWLAAAVILWCAALLAQPRDQAAVLIALGIGGPLWFYAVSGWEHAQAVAFSTAAFACVVRARGARTAWIAGVLLGAGATQRDEVVLLLPGLLLFVWLRWGSWTLVAKASAGAIAVLVVAGAIDVIWFQRPPAVHLRHAVHMLQSAMQITTGPNPDVPVLAKFTQRDRYQTVIQYWLLGYGNTRWIVAFAAGFAAAIVAAWRWRTSAVLLAWVLAIAALAVADLSEMVTAPKWLAGMLRVSPYLVFAFLPGPGTRFGFGVRSPDRPNPGSGTGFGRSGDLTPTAVLWTAVAYLAIAYAGVDTTGGKSLGPRLLLPLFPLLGVGAIATIREYATAAAPLDRWIGRIGIGLVAVAIAIHAIATIRVYVARNHDNAAALAAVQAARERIVVTDDEAVAQLLLPLYYRKTIFLVYYPWLNSRFQAMLADQHVPDALLVTRNEAPALRLFPLNLTSSEHRGRMLIEHWHR